MFKIHKKLSTGESVKVVPFNGTVLTAVQLMAKHLDPDHELVLVSDRHGEIVRMRLANGAGAEVTMTVPMFVRYIGGIIAKQRVSNK